MSLKMIVGVAAACGILLGAGLFMPKGPARAAPRAAVESLSASESPSPGASPSPSASPSASPTAPAEDIAYVTRVSIHYRRAAGEFKGRVFSEAARCYRHRTVRLKRTKNGRQRVVAEVTSNRDGVWRVAESDPSGSYFASAPASSFAPEGEAPRDCLQDRSRSIRP